MRRIGSVDDHVAVDELAKIRRLVHECFIWRGVEKSVFSAVIVIPVRALTAGAGAELREFYNLQRISDVVEAHTAEPFVILAFVIEARVVILAHGRFGSRIRDGSLRPGHENPFLQIPVVSDLHLSAFEAPFVVEHGLSNVADVDDIALLKHEAAISDGHQLHFAVAHMAWHEVGENLHVVDVRPAIKIGDAVGRRMAVMVGPSCKRRTNQSQTGTHGRSQEFSPTGREGILRRDLSPCSPGIQTWCAGLEIHVARLLGIQTRGSQSIGLPSPGKVGPLYHFTSLN